MGSSPSRVKLKTLKLVFVVSLLGTHHKGLRAKTGCLGIRIIYPSETTCLPADNCFSVLACSCHDIGFINGVKQ
jgi:hypothetical protein